MQTHNSNYERNLISKGIKLIAGIDEVGRGPLAGPLVVCAVILDLSKLTFNDTRHQTNNLYTQITDSKKLTAKKRRELSKFLIDEVRAYSIVTISNKILDKKGMALAIQTAYTNALKKLKVAPQHILTDFIPIKALSRETQTNITKGDQLSITVAAASIIAKVYRDDLMTKYHNKYPQYGFDAHKGYGTRKHLQALAKFGPSEIHRRSFKPVKNLLKEA